jgi:hypothetical protein
MFSSLLSTILSIVTLASQASLPLRPAHPAIPAATLDVVRTIDASLGLMRREEGERPTESPVAAYYDQTGLRKIEAPEFDEAFYLVNGVVIYATSSIPDDNVEALFQNGVLVLTLRKGRLAKNNPGMWTTRLADMKRTLEEEKVFANAPLEEKGSDLDVRAAKKELDAMAEKIDAAKGEEVVRSIGGVALEGARLTGRRVNGVWKKVELRAFGETFQSGSTYYFRDNKPFLIVDETYDYTHPFTVQHSRVGGYDEDRYYFFHKDGGFNTSDSWDEKYVSALVQVLEQPVEYVSLEKVGDSWKIDTPDPQKPISPFDQ